MEDNNYRSEPEQFEPCHYSDRLMTRLLLLNEKVGNQVDIGEVRKAIYYAKKYHALQYRQSGEPYYSHPVEVAYMFAVYTAEEKIRYFRTDLIVTAILHDTIEDTELTKDVIESVFGVRVANQVEDLTRIKDGYKISSAEMVETLWLQKKYDVLLIKQFDRLHNMQTIGVKKPEKIRKIANETFNSFVVFAMHEQHKDLEKLMYRLCCETLSIEAVTNELTEIMEHDSHLISLEDTDTHQLVSQVFQNVTSQTGS